ncbi:H-2 class II histocompatibility antigen, E-K alpha chain [Peromyscus maniculatus bairdii]|uniref:Histocompatibility 2, class II antigen E alpha n=1 Tax=Peromyscus maniculatus bairdii TaxID=230844 RepID=A0A6I9MEH5_PERMB|nr:H-2 class II histocompatibility antigen, E-K alpha chain [Peromyscus maniculatus bairdii]XP_028743889.1 H-2 class II histocompatibility antigen, E-K alpha chain [Peromyscus leucopus]
MATTGAMVLRLFFMVVLMGPQKSWAIKEEHTIIQAEFFLSPDQNGEFMFDFDGDEIFHVDTKNSETIWRLKEFGQFASFEAQGALANIAVDRANLDIMIKRSNHTPDVNVAPEVTVLPNSPVSLGEPNILICFVDKFSPPVVNVTWLRNGKPVITGVSETVFLPREDHLFRKFHYLTFLPSTTDVYDCRVEHWGLEEPLLKHWEFEEQTPLPETKENLVCALGLFVGLVGIIAGVVFIIKGMQRRNAAERRQGAL